MTSDDIKGIFSNFALAYGNQFLEKWKAVDADAMADLWLSKLRRYEGREEVIFRAMDTVIETHQFPPNLPEFLVICSEHSMSLAKSEPRLVSPVSLRLPDNRPESDKVPLTKEKKMEMIKAAIGITLKAIPK